VNVFISYGDSADQMVALRLQALGAVHGLTIYVPPVWLRQERRAVPGDADVQEKLKHADAVLAWISSNMTAACQHETTFAASSGKSLLVLAPASVPRVKANFPTHWVEVDPSDPSQTENRLAECVARLGAKASEKSALLALGALALGMSLLPAAVGR
jgi:hypothetical protein